MREDEVERAAAAPPHMTVSMTSPSGGGDQAADGLVLEERLAVDIVDDAREQDPGAGEQRAEREDEREGPASETGAKAPAR